MFKKNRRAAKAKSSKFKSTQRRSLLQRLEDRQMMAAHIVGNSTVFATIQAAVDAAAPGATINVDAGTYHESVAIAQSVTIRGAQAGVDARGNARLSGANETILDGALSGSARTCSFYISANDVTIDGFTVQGNTTTGQTGAGIVIAPNKAGAHIINNIVQNNVSGLFLANNSSTDAAVIQHNVFRNNNNAGANGGRGIYTDQSIFGTILTNVTIDANMFYNNRGSNGTTGLEAAVAFESGISDSQTNLRVTNNVFDTNGKAVLFFNTDNALVQGNYITHTLDWYSGTIRCEGNNHNISILYNTMFLNTGPAVAVDSKGVPGDSSGFVVNYNNFYGNSTHTGTNISVVYTQTQYDGTFDARFNYWGSATGPGGDGPGTGDKVYGNAHVVSGSSWSVSPGGTELYSSWSTTPIGSPSAPFWGLAPTDGAPIQVEDFDNGGEGYGYHDIDTVNTNGAYRTTGVDIEPSSDTGGGYDVGWTAAGEWLGYTTNITQTGTYTIDFRVSSNGAGGTFHLEIDGTNVTGAMTVPNTGAWQTFQTISKTGVNITAGQHNLRIVFDTIGAGGYVGDFNWLKLTNTSVAPVPAAPTSLSAAVAAATWNQINLNWTNNATNQTGFKIERSTDSVNFTLLTTVGAAATSYNDTGLSPTKTYTYRVRATNAAGDSNFSNVASATTPVDPTAPVNLSDLTWTSATAGWGTVTKNASIKGNTITLRGQTYSTGIGTHASSQIVYNIAGKYNTFTSDVGVDDEVAGTGSVRFQVIGDGVVLYDSGILTNASPIAHINISLAGVQQLTLIAANGIDDSIDYDHADWAGAQLLPTGTLTPTAPSAPTTLTAASATNKINLNWTDTSTNEDGFRIERSTDNINFTQIGSVATNIATYSDTTAAAGQTYYYRVIAFNAVGTSAYSNTTSAAIPTAPTAPTTLTATTTSGMKLAWTDTSSNEDGFRIERSTDNVNFTQIGATAPNIATYIDPTAAAGQTYYYRVLAFNSVGTSSYSNTVSAALPAAPTAPSAPTTLTATTTSGMQLSWTDTSTNEDGFRIERSTDNINFTQIGTTATNIATYTDATAAAGQTYYYRVLAFNSVGTSTYSNTVTAALPAAPTAPTAPTTLTATTTSGMKLSWIDTSTNEDGFRIERSTDNINFTQIGSTATNIATYTDATAAAGQTYYYRVLAFNSVGNSTFSNTVTAALPAAPTAPTAPTTLTATTTSGMKLSWTDTSSNEDGFRIERSTDNINFTQIGTTATNIATYADATAAAGQTYYYRILAFNSVGTSTYSNTVTAALPAAPTAPTAPTTLTATTTSGMKLSWTDTSSNEDGFRIERSTDNVNFTQIGTTATNIATYTDATAAAGQTYYYRVLAYNSVGTSTYSNTVSATLPSAPIAPTVLTATVSTNQIKLAWTDNSFNEDGFRIERSTDNVNFTQIASSSTNAASYTDTTATPGQIYYYRVRAYNVTGNSAYTNTANATIPPLPVAPTTLAAAVATTTVKLTWADKSTNETGFLIERSTDNVTFTQIATTAANAVTYTDSTPVAGQIYYYRVRATNATGNSAYTNTANATVPAPALPAPWADTDIGAPGQKGSATVSNGVYTVKGGGADIWGNADSFNYVNQSLTGNGTIIARVSSVGNTDGWAKSGIMFRESLAAGAKQVALFVTPANGVALQSRATTGGASTNLQNTGITAPQWLKLNRKGNVFTAYRSANGTTWTLVGSVTVSMTSTIYVGLAVTAHNNSLLSTSTFDNVSVVLG